VPPLERVDGTALTATPEQSVLSVDQPQVNA
jgi:hypothetical protein